MLVSRPTLWLVMAGVGLLVYLLVPGALGELAAGAFTDGLAGARVNPVRSVTQTPVLVITLDDPARDQLGMPPPASALARAVTLLEQSGAACIGLDTRIERASDGLDALAAALKASGHVVLRDGAFGSETLSWHPALSAAASARGKVRFVTLSGPEVRGVSLESDTYLLELIRKHRSGLEARIERGHLSVAGTVMRPTTVGLADGSALLFTPPTLTELPQVSLTTLLAGKVSPELIRGRIVLIGATAIAVAQPVPLPGGAIWPDVLVEAAAVDALLSQRAIDVVGEGTHLAVFLVLLATLALAGSFGRFLVAPVAVAAVLLLQVGFSAYAFTAWSWRPSPLGAILGLTAAGLVLILGRAWESFVTSGRFGELMGRSAALAAEENYDRAIALIRSSQFEPAIPLLQQVMRTDPSRRNQALVQILTCYLVSHEFELVEDTFKQIFLENLSLEECYDLGLQLTQAGYFEEARTLFALIFNRDVNFRDVKHQLELVTQAQASRKDVMERLIIKELRKDYRNLEMIRRGGMAIIYQGYSASMDKVVAIKILSPHLNDNADVVKRFFLEADTMKEFDHPNIVKVFTIHREGQLRFYSMECVYPSETLYDLIEKEKKLTIDRSIHILKQMCLALEYAHVRHIVHRDIKPHNVLIAPGDLVKLIDFGIARFENLSTMTSTGVVMGTPRYMSPEQIKGERVDERTDIYALGVCFFEMLTGILGAENPMLEKVKGRTSIYQLILRQNLPSPLVRMVLKCLEGSRDTRYATARALYTDLEEYERLPQAALEM